jgi:WD40 repeat protein
LPAELPHSAVPIALSFSRDGGRLAVGCQSGPVLIWDLATKMTRSCPEVGAVSNVAFARDGLHLAASSLEKGIRIWNVGSLSMREVATFVSDSPVLSIGFVAGMRHLAVATTSQIMLHVWRPKDVAAAAARLVSRGLTREEWKRYFGEERYRRTPAPSA